MKIFVGSLPFSTEEEELRGYFEEYGEVNSVAIIMDKFSGKSRGFGFVEMADDEQAKKAIEALDGAELGGRTIVVNQAEDKRDSPRRSSFGGGGNSGGYNKGGYSKGGGGSDYNQGGYNKGGSGGYGKGGSKKGGNNNRY